MQKIEEENRSEEIVKEEIEEEPWQRKGKYKEKKKVNVREAVKKLEEEREREEREKRAKREKEEEEMYKMMSDYWDRIEEKKIEEEKMREEKKKRKEIIIMADVFWEEERERIEEERKKVVSPVAMKPRPTARRGVLFRRR